MLNFARQICSKDKVALIGFYYDDDCKIFLLRDRVVENKGFWIKTGAADDFGFGKGERKVFALASDFRMKQEYVPFALIRQFNQSKYGIKSLHINPP